MLRVETHMFKRSRISGLDVLHAALACQGLSRCPNSSGQCKDGGSELPRGSRCEHGGFNSHAHSFRLRPRMHSLAHSYSLSVDHRGLRFGTPCSVPIARTVFELSCDTSIVLFRQLKHHYVCRRRPHGIVPNSNGIPRQVMCQHSL